MRKLSVILLLCITASAFAQFQQKPLLGIPISSTHPLGTGSGGLKAAWFFLEGSGGQAFDLSGNGNTGSLIADTHFVPGKFGSALDFDGTGDVVRVAHSSILNVNHFTIVIWIKSDTSSVDLSAAEGFISKDDGGTQPFRIMNNATENAVRFRFEVVGKAGQNVDGSIALDADRWYQIVCTYDQVAARLYINTVLDNSLAETAVLDTNADDLCIGCLGNVANEFAGQIDHVIIYNRALSESERALLYREPFCMFEQDNIALMVETLAPTGGQVIMITSLPWILSIPLLYGIVYLIRTKYKEVA
ncbi:hypothetical protein LCGC14_2327960 [marine sediment metagenome]|uniref:LamG-like jellyroll fold domain-containing protein n=1 Tax=marine sediment metagenome TaxID=412755 RepID=A0A0F9ETC9_9ZZZZ